MKLNKMICSRYNSLSIITSDQCGMTFRAANFKHMPFVRRTLITPYILRPRIKPCTTKQKVYATLNAIRYDESLQDCSRVCLDINSRIS